MLIIAVIIMSVITITIITFSHTDNINKHNKQVSSGLVGVLLNF